ncbi:hypothetical protein BDV98DRAFT_500164, partial [Pterulicium gracile]
GSDEEESSSKPKKSSGFASLASEMPDDDMGDEDFGGLMSAIKASSKKKDKKKKGTVERLDFPEEDDTSAQDTVEQEKKPVEVTADDLADEEWGAVKEKGKKGKKGQKNKPSAAEPVEKQEAPPAPVAEDVADVADVAEEAGEDDGPKVLSKKEKERLKKEKDKAKKKAQAAAKKAAVATEEPTEAPPTPSAEPPSKEEEAGDDDEATGAGGDSKKKKKKKKAKKEEEETPAPNPAAGGAGKKKGAISALKAMMDERKRLEEEIRQREEEHRKRIEEEERQAEEEERKKEEEKQRRKEKEKAKKELAKKEGRLLTKKQKEEKAAAERRKAALLASGVQIEGLQQPSGTTKKAVYGKKKKGPSAQSEAPAASHPSSRSETPDVVSPAPQPPSSPAPPTEAEPKDDWDASSDEENVPPATHPDGGDDVKSDWDASSDEDEPAPDVKAEVPQGAPSKQGTQKDTSKPVSNSVTPAQPARPSPTSTDESDEDSEEDSDESDSDSDSDDELTTAQRIAAQKKAQSAARREEAHKAALAARSKDNLRSPICCILGHVDTGKTKLLDKIRQTNVQEGEAGGITQQIGATYFPLDAIKTKTLVVNKDGSQEYKIPGLLVIDTPGHESFSNLRSRGSSLCNIAILVVDIMHGLEPQTLESLRLLRDRKAPFIVALNKIDRIYGWKPTPDGAFRESLASQSPSVVREFEDRLQKTTLAFAEQGLNAVLYYENKNMGRNVSLVPTSAVTGEGVPDMIMLLVQLTQQRLSESLMYLSELECTVLEVKVIEGLGTTIDVVLSNGILREGDRIVICGLNGPIVTQVRALLTPQPLREMRIKSAYVHHKEVKAALGVKISAPDLEKAIAGSRLLVVGPDNDEDDLRDEVMSDLTSLLSNIDKSGRGVCVQASTLGSLEALLDFLKASKIPVSGINIGPVHKKDVMRCGTMLEKAKELACLLCFDVPVDRDAERLADEMGIKIFKADIIYHLFDAFTAYNAEIMEAKRRDAAPQAVWPCRLKTLQAFAKRDPIILGVDILDGTLRIGTPLAVVKVDPATGKKDIISLGKITSLEINHKSFEIVKKSQAGAGVAVKIEHAVYQSAKMFGRHFDEKDEILSLISRQSIDVLKESFKADVSMEEWHLIKALKPVSTPLSRLHQY